MSNLTRWEPMREMMSLRGAMDRLFDEAFTRPFSLSGVSAVPAIDLYQTDDEVVVQTALPGYKPEDVHISITGEQLSLRGEFKRENGHENATYHIREQSSGSFERSITLPTHVQTDQAKAEFENGILTITLPKSETVKPKTIKIKAR